MNKKIQIDSRLVYANENSNGSAAAATRTTILIGNINIQNRRKKQSLI